VYRPPHAKGKTEKNKPRGIPNTVGSAGNVGKKRVAMGTHNFSFCRGEVKIATEHAASVGRERGRRRVSQFPVSPEKLRKKKTPGRGRKRSRHRPMNDQETAEGRDQHAKGRGGEEGNRISSWDQKPHLTGGIWLH